MKYIELLVIKRGINMMNNRKIYIMILMIISISIFSGIVSGTENQPNHSYIREPIMYKSFIDTSGFYKVLNMTTSKIEPYKNGTLKIYMRDTVIWVNDDQSEKRFTVVSKQKLWKNESGILGGRDKQFSYTFNKSGIYAIYLKEYPNLRFQKIIVSQINTTGNGSNKNTSKVNITKSKAIKKNTTKKDNTKSKTNSKNTKTIPKSTPKATPGNSIAMTMVVLVSLVIFLRYKKR